MNILIIGGAGFIGSHITEFYVDKNNVTVYDNFSSGKMWHLDGIKNNKNFKIDEI